MRIGDVLSSNQKDQQEINRIRKNYHEVPPSISAEEFVKVVESRRSVRRFTQEAVPPEIVRECVRLALLAPSSSSLQPAEFYWIRQTSLRERLVPICMGQPAAKTAAELIVCVARTDTWRANARDVLSEIRKVGEPSVSTVHYYEKLLRLQLSVGALSWWVPIKWLIYNVPSLFRPMLRFPLGKNDLKLWAVKSTALACENLMLAFRAFGYDTCPMEGFDEPKVKKLLKLPNNSSVVMVVAAGRRAQGGIYGPQVRLPTSRFLFEINEV